METILEIDYKLKLGIGLEKNDKFVLELSIYTIYLYLLSCICILIQHPILYYSIILYPTTILFSVNFTDIAAIHLADCCKFYWPCSSSAWSQTPRYSWPCRKWPACPIISPWPLSRSMTKTSLSGVGFDVAFWEACKICFKCCTNIILCEQDFTDCGLYAEYIIVTYLYCNKMTMEGIKNTILVTLQPSPINIVVSNS